MAQFIWALLGHQEIQDDRTYTLPRTPFLADEGHGDCKLLLNLCIRGIRRQYRRFPAETPKVRATALAWRRGARCRALVSPRWPPQFARRSCLARLSRVWIQFNPLGTVDAGASGIGSNRPATFTYMISPIAKLPRSVLKARRSWLPGIRTKSPRRPCDGELT